MLEVKGSYVVCFVAWVVFLRILATELENNWRLGPFWWLTWLLFWGPLLCHVYRMLNWLFNLLCAHRNFLCLLAFFSFISFLLLNPVLKFTILFSQLVKQVFVKFNYLSCLFLLSFKPLVLMLHLVLQVESFLSLSFKVSDRTLVLGFLINKFRMLISAVVYLSGEDLVFLLKFVALVSASL